MDNTAKNLPLTQEEIDKDAEELILALGEPTPPGKGIPLEEVDAWVRKYAGFYYPCTKI